MKYTFSMKPKETQAIMENVSRIATALVQAIEANDQNRIDAEQERWRRRRQEQQMREQRTWEWECTGTTQDPQDPQAEE